MWSSKNKINKKLLESTDGGWIYQEVADHISKLLHNKEDFIFGVEKILGAPQSIKNIHYLWLFSSEVSGNGLNGFVFNGSCSDLEWLLTLKALRAIEATEMLQRLESAIVLALQDEFILDEHDLSNFTDLKIYSQFDTVEKIDENIYELASSPFDKIVADYIRKHEHDIFE